MTTTVTKTVGPGKNYTSLSGYEAGEQANLVTLDQIRVAMCYAFDDFTVVVFAGSTTDYNRHYEVRCAAGEGHPGYYDATKYRLTNATYITCSASVFWFDIQVKHPDQSAAGFNITANVSVEINRCIVDGANWAVITQVSAGIICTVRNCLFYNVMGGLGASGANYALSMYYTTVLANGGAGYTCFSVTVNGTQVPNCQVNYFSSLNTPCINTTAGAVLSGNTTSDATAGAGGLNNISIAAAKFKSPSTNNYKPQSDSPLIGRQAGTSTTLPEWDYDLAGQYRNRGGVMEGGCYMLIAPTVITKTVGPLKDYIGGLTSWEAGEQADLIALNQAKVAQCYSMLDSNYCDISGWLTGYDNNILVTCPTTERHAGVWDVAKYRIAASFSTIGVKHPYVTLEYLQVEATSTGLALADNGTDAKTILRGLLVRGTANSGNALIQMYADLEIYNTIAYRNPGDNGNRCLECGNPGKTINIVNSTFAGGNIVVNNYGGTCNFINSYAGGGAQTFGGGNTYVNSAGDLVGAIAGQLIVVPYNATTFASIVAPVNLHIGGGSSLLRNACPLHAKAPLDIDGQTRVATTDIGADYWILPPPTLSLKTVKAAGGNYLDLASWESGEQCDMVAVNLYKQVDVYAGSSNAGGILVSGWANTDNQRTITINVPATERHAGLLDLSKVHLIGSGITNLIMIDVNFVNIKGMQFRHSGTGSCILYNNGSFGTVDGAILTTTVGAVASKLIWLWSGSCNVYNTLAYRPLTDGQGEGIRVEFSGSIVNCTVIGGQYGIFGNGGAGNSAISINKTYMGGATVCLAGTGYVNNACATSDGSGSTTIVPVNNTTFRDVGNDYHLGTGSALKGATVVDVVAPLDIDGQARSNPSDIGADFYSAPVFMVIVKSVKFAGQGGNYTTMTGWESGRQGDLITRNTAEIAEGYDGLKDFGFTIQGWSTSATNYIICRAAAGNGHVGVIDKNKYGLVSTSGNMGIDIATPNVTISRIQMQATDPNANGISITTPNNFYDVLIDSCLLDGVSTTGNDKGIAFYNSGANAAKLKVQNTIVFNYTNGVYAEIASLAAGTFNILGCTLIADKGILIAGSGNVYIEYTYAKDFDIAAGTNFGASRSNAGSVLVNVPGTNPIQVGVDSVTFVNPINDFHITQNSNLRARGFSSQLTTDIDGQARGLTGIFDTGADQYSGFEIQASGSGGVIVHPTRAIALGQV